MKAVSIIAALALVPLAGCNAPAPSLKKQIDICDMEAQRVYVVRPKSNENYLDQLSYIVTCMRAQGYDIDFNLPDCDGSGIPSPQLKPMCYKPD